MGRAGGGGGGHSSGGHSSSHSGGGHSVSHSRAGSGSSYSHSRAGSGSSRSSYSSGGYSSYHSSYNYGSTYSRSHINVYNGDVIRGRSGTSNTLAKVFGIIISIVVFIVIMMLIISASTGTTPKSTRNREKLTDSPAFYSDCVVDELYWFDNVNSAGSKLKNFYDKTGIQPYIYLKAYDSELQTYADKEEYAYQLFDDLGLSESTFLFVYFAEEDQDNDVGYMYYVSGKQVDSVMDDEAVDIFWAYIDKYWYSDASTDVMFEKAFDSTATSIMTKSKTTADVLCSAFVAIGIIGAFVLVIVIRKQKRKHEAEKARETERILKTPMQDLVNGSANDPLVNKYDK